MIDLADEMQLAASAALLAGDALAFAGISEWRRLVEARLIGLAWGQLGRSGYFEPASRGDGAPFIVTPAIEGGEIADLAAISLAHPSRWGRRTGDAAFIGADAIEEAIRSEGWGDAPEPLRFHPHPLAWLRAGASGAAPLGRLDQFALSTLRDVPLIVVASAKLARRLEYELSRPARMPRIIVEAPR